MFSSSDFSIQSVLAVLYIALGQVTKLVHSPPVNASMVKKEPEQNHVNLTNHIIIVTGSNTGIGKSTAIKLAKCGGTVILACRNKKEGMKAMMHITEVTEKCSEDEYPFAKNSKVLFMRLDLSDLKSVYGFVERFKAEFPRLDILINNAGLNTAGTTKNGLEQLFQVNYLGHFLLVKLLEDIMSGGSGLSGPNVPAVARVVNLSSVMHHCGQADYKSSAYSQFSISSHIKYSYYSDSKLYMNLLTMEINKRFDTQRSYGGSIPPATAGKRPIVALSANPGAVRSDIWRNSILSNLNFVMKMLFLDVDEGSATSFYAATVDLSTLRQYQRECASQSVNMGDNYVKTPYIPYVIPYAMPANTLAYETMNSFAGPRFNGVSFPAAETLHSDDKTPDMNPLLLAERLWAFSEATAEKHKEVVIEQQRIDMEMK